MKRTDVHLADVFISWTGADAALKDQIANGLESHHMRVLLSDRECQGNFKEWSRTAATSAHIFMPIITEASLHSKGMEWEQQELDKLLQSDKGDYWKDAIVPVCSNLQIFETYKARFSPKAQEKLSALSAVNLAQSTLENICQKASRRISSHFFNLYRNNRAEHIKLIPLYASGSVTRNLQFKDLYVQRTITEIDENQEDGSTFDSPNELLQGEGIPFLYGPAGSGKTQYIHQIMEQAAKDQLVLSLSCADASVNGQDLFHQLYTAFHQTCGQRKFFTLDDFQALLSRTKPVVVLDGLDEITTNDATDSFLLKIDKFHNSNPDIRLIFTGRNRDDGKRLVFGNYPVRHFRLNQLTEPEIQTLSSRLFLLFGATDKGVEFYEETQKLSNEIRSNPLLLSQLAIIYQDSGKIPQTVVGILEAVSEISLRADKVSHANLQAIPPEYAPMVQRDISDILKRFSRTKYETGAQEQNYSSQQIMAQVLYDKYGEDEGACLYRTNFLLEYLQNRAFFVDGKFYHKMFLEYFAGVSYFDSTFDFFKKIKNTTALAQLFSHYRDDHWSQVIQLFLSKADSVIDSAITTQLYQAILHLAQVRDYTLLLDTCRDLLRHRQSAELVLATDLLTKSAQGEYPPYGPLFWYVPEYDLYGTLLSALAGLQDEPCFTKALALTRDVCWIFGKYHTAESVNHQIDGKALLAKAELSGVRKGLCELFYQGRTDYADGNDIYPRCFNMAEAVSWKEVGQGIYGRMTTPFEDELGLYSHEMLRPFGGEWVGVVSMGYDITRIEELLPSRSCSKLRGLFLSPSWYLKMQKLAINDKHLSVIYVPECTHFLSDSMNPHPFVYPGIYINDNGLMYFDNKIILPDGITKIGTYAFAGCNSLTSITIPEGVTEIGWSAFGGCSSLVSIVMPESVTEIGYGSFAGCSSLSSITIPEGVTYIGISAFEGCSSLASITIPRGISRIERNTFSRCSALTSIILPEGITEIGLCAFAGCSLLGSVTIPASVTEIGQDAFNNCSSLTSISVPDGVTKIRCGVFSDCSSVTSITIPEGVTKIEKDAFGGCSALTSITIPEGVTKLGWDAFNSCSALTSITIPDSVTEIGGRAFNGCSALASITLPNGITRIECDTFAGCSALTSITIPAGVTEIGDSAFCGCSALTSITIPDSVAKIGFRAFAGCNALTCISNCPTQYHREHLRVSDECVIAYREGRQCGDDVYDQADTVCIVLSQCATGIGLFALADYRPLPSIPFSDTLFKIAPNIWAYRRSSLTSIAIPKGVTEIGCSAFSGCLVLTSITIPEGVIEIGAHAFSCCSELTSITIPGSVTKIGQHAFGGCSGLTSITIPKGVTQIKWDTFYGCSTLTSITLPEGIIEIESNVFRDCRSLSSITIPETVTTIGTFAFAGCSKLTSITLPAGISKIEWNVFKGCRSLASITIPDSVSEICRGAFSNCSSLTSFTIPQKVTKIDAHTFNGCSSLTSIFIPKSVRSIGDNAFAGCVGLRQITLSRRFEEDLPRIFPGVDLSKVKIIWH